ncbi:MAG: CPBP family intramembrane glutamic endopeptidase [Burkholderiales bacterium]
MSAAGPPQGARPPGGEGRAAPIGGGHSRDWDRKPAFWIAYALVAAAALALAWRLFPLALPLVSLEITMTRDQALAQAEALAGARKLAPPGARSAIVFNQDAVAQNYVELEGGGKPAFARLVEGRAYAPFWWDVRLFKVGEIEEVLIRFRPDGVLDGFIRNVPETYVRDPATQALTAEAALALARKQATDEWNVDFAPYRLLDQAQLTRPSGRVDHQFVFERGEAIGDARIRLAVTVAGDELIQVHPFVHVPESFGRRFAQMRSANNTIASVASVAAGVLYGLVGCILGALWLLRKHSLIWQPALAAGLAIGALLAGALLAGSPSAWFTFSTAQTEASFWWRQIGLALLVFIGGGLALGEVFMASEGLARRAFPDHPQLWRLWSRDAAATGAVAGRTAGGYLFVPVELALIAAFYFVTNRWLGWWQPSETLTDPNILASAVPALAPIAMSLQAGFMEECVFRAVPLALGALIGARFGHRRAGIAIAFVLQAVIFGAAHANYPGFPAYSRLVELVVPAMMWALIFLRYGLLPTILLHTLFDLVLFSIPLFLVDAPGAATQRALVIAAALVPALVVLARRVQTGAWGRFPDALRNRAWQPQVPAAGAPAPAAAPRAVQAGALAFAVQRWMPALGGVGLIAWATLSVLRADVPPLAIGRAEAESQAAAALAQRGVVPGAEWRRLSTTRSAVEDGTQRQWHAFAWREAGRDAYRALVGGALAPPLWDVRFARFDGDVAERAEEWRVTVAGDGRVRQVVHVLPEERAGARLAREPAQALAEDALRQRLALDPATLVLRSADETQRPARRDWTFTYADPRVALGLGGEARVQVAIAGDEVAVAGRSVFVPQTWRRAEEEREGEQQFARYAGAGIIALAGIAALVYAVIAWKHGRNDRRAFLWVGGLALAMVIAGSLNNAPNLAFHLRTAEPIANQWATTILSRLAGSLLLGLLMGLLAGVGAHYAQAHRAARAAWRLPAWTYGVAAALATAGIAAALGSLVPQLMPTWPDLKVPAAAWPWAGAATAGLAVVPAAALMLFLLSAVDFVTDGWTRRLPVVALALALLGVAVAAMAGAPTGLALLQGTIEGVTTLAFAWLVLRFDLRTVPAFAATGVILEAGRSASLAGTDGAWASFALTALIACASAWAVTRYMERPGSVYVNT